MSLPDISMQTRLNRHAARMDAALQHLPRPEDYTARDRFRQAVMKETVSTVCNVSYRIQ